MEGTFLNSRKYIDSKAHAYPAIEAQGPPSLVVNTGHFGNFPKTSTLSRKEAAPSGDPLKYYTELTVRSKRSVTQKFLRSAEHRAFR